MDTVGVEIGFERVCNQVGEYEYRRLGLGEFGLRVVTKSTGDWLVSIVICFGR